MISKNINTSETQWHQAIPGELIHSDEVHVLRVFLDVTALQRENLLRILSADEVERAGRFRFERDQNRFIVARGILRQILGHYLGKKPQELRFKYTLYGKPELTTDTGYDTLRFNLSHSDTFALYAITRGRNIGIDIERVRNDISVEQISRRFFSQGEISSLEKIHQDNQTEAFFQYWTRKEALIKAMGKGVSFPMELCNVSLLNGRCLSTIELLGDKIENSCWYGQDLFPGQGYAAAIAVEGDNWDFSYWNYSEMPSGNK